MLFKTQTLLAALLSIQPAVGRSVLINETEGIEKRATGFQNNVYFPNWVSYDREYFPWDLPAAQLKAINYAFCDVQENGAVVVADSFADYERRYPGDSEEDSGTNAYGNVKQLYLLKKNNRQLKVILGIGGWTHSGNFPSAVSTAANRARFATSAVRLVKDWGFDGIDIDWEYPSNAVEAANLVLLLKAVRAALDAYSTQYANGYKFMLTIATSAVPDYYNILKLKEMNPYLDFINLMGYDFSGPWTKTAAHQSNIYSNPANIGSTPFSAHAALTAYSKAGIPVSKLILGMPLYGHAFDNTAGLGLSYSGVNDGSTDQGIWDYRSLPPSGATEIYDAKARASYSYDSKTKQLITYDTVNVVQRKVAYMKDKALAGAMFWEASGDKTGAASLIGASYTALGGLDSSQNLLNYPQSKYANIVAGMP